MEEGKSNDSVDLRVVSADCVRALLLGDYRVAFAAPVQRFRPGDYLPDRRDCHRTKGWRVLEIRRLAYRLVSVQLQPAHVGNDFNHVALDHYF